MKVDIIKEMLFWVTVILCTQGVLGQSSNSSSTISPEGCGWPPSAGPKPTKWREEEIPNPRVDVCKCGRYGKLSWVCDPNNIISTKEADDIDREIDELRSSTGGCHCGKKCSRDPHYHGYQAGVVFLQGMYMPTSSPSASYKRKTADDITDYLRDDDWEFGLCDDDLVILVSDQDRFVYTATGDEISGIVTNDCVDQITANNKAYLSNKQYGQAVQNMVREYILALNKEHSCNKGVSLSTGAIVGILAGLFGGGVLAFILQRKCCPGCCKGGSSSSGKSSYHTTSRGRSYSASSNSSGGGGGGF